MISAIARWCECLHGQAPLFEALEQLTKSIGAEATALSRASRQPDGKSNLLTYDKQGRTSTHPLNRSYARSILGAFYDKPKPGSIWIKSTVETHPNPLLLEFHRHRKMSELVVIPLAVTDVSIDCFEFHFHENLSSTHHTIFNMIGVTLTQTWSNRSPGLFTNNLLRLERRNSNDLPTGPILSMDNPARLSRAEYRVCLLLSKGLSAKRVQTELSVCQSTIRTHLSSIYAKTNTSNQSELMYRLLTFAPIQTDQHSDSDVA